MSGGILWTSAEAVEATWGISLVSWQATGVSIDTRTLQPGDLFVALSDTRDGHDFIAQAMERGAAACLVSHIPDDVDETVPLLVVDDVLAGLAALGRYARARSRARVVGVTGSVGKTSVKEMLRTILSGQGSCHVSASSYNNHWGVPLSLARLPADTDFAVIEIGMNHPGEIGPLSRMTAPDVALITTVAAAHLEAFDSIDEIAAEKAAIFSGMTGNGIAVFNADLATTPILAGAARAAGGRIVTFGEAATADFRIDDVTVVDTATVVQARHGNQPLLFKVASPGRHLAINALCALAVADALCCDPVIAICDLATWAPPPGRGTREHIALDKGDPTLTAELIDDAFNANPASMAAALAVLAASAPVGDVGRIAHGRRIAVLGDMLELGRDAGDLHVALGDLPDLGSVDVIHCVGPLMQQLYNRLPEERRGLWTADARDLADRAHTLIDAGDIILVKGSKGIRVSIVVDAIRRLGRHHGARGELRETPGIGGTAVGGAG